MTGRGGRRLGAGRKPGPELTRVTAFVAPELAAEVARLCDDASDESGIPSLTRGDILAIAVELARGNAADRDRFLQLAFRQLARRVTSRKA